MIPDLSDSRQRRVALEAATGLMQGKVPVQAQVPELEQAQALELVQGRVVKSTTDNGARHTLCHKIHHEVTHHAKCRLRLLLQPPRHAQQAAQARPAVAEVPPPAPARVLRRM